MTANTFRHNQNQQRMLADIPIHHVHSLTKTAGMAADQAPAAFVGQWGSISIDLINQCLRIHDDTTPGGVGVVPLFANPIGRISFPFTPLEWGALEFAANTPVTFTHNFGRFASVRVISSTTGQELDVDIVHNMNKRSFTVEFGVLTSAFVIAQ